MITFLFWNLNKKPLAQKIAKITKRKRVDLIILAECSIPSDEMLSSLIQSTGEPFFRSYSQSAKLALYTKFSKRFFKPVSDAPRHTIQRLSLPLKPEILVGALHLPSPLYTSKESRAMESGTFARELTRVEELAGHKRTIVVGDFNMNPFDDGLVGAGAFNAAMTKEVASRRSRTVNARNYDFFYNPMWSLFGDGSYGPPGTYYYDRSEHVNCFWNMFDQVLIRPDLLRGFRNEDLEILTTDGDASLLTPKGLPDKAHASDHLPILFRINI